MNVRWYDSPDPWVNSNKTIEWMFLKPETHLESEPVPFFDMSKVERLQLSNIANITTRNY